MIENRGGVLLHLKSNGYTGRDSNHAIFIFTSLFSGGQLLKERIYSWINNRFPLLLEKQVHSSESRPTFAMKFARSDLQQRDLSLLDCFTDVVLSDKDRTVTNQFLGAHKAESGSASAQV